MVGVIGRREAGDRLVTLRETGDSAKIGLSPSGRLGDSDPLSSPCCQMRQSSFICRFFYQYQNVCLYVYPSHDRNEIGAK